MICAYFSFLGAILVIHRTQPSRMYYFYCVLAVQAFKELGETLKRQRQADDVYNLEYFLGSSDCDPASINQLLEEKLQENKKLYGSRIDEVSLAFVNEFELLKSNSCLY